jgi:hypothetical protein
MRVLAVTACLFASLAQVHAQPAADKVAVGPWDIVTSYRGNAFVNCEMRRTSEGLGITFLRDEDGLSLLLDSGKWKLERGKTYDVKLTAGRAAMNGKALAESKGVAIEMPDRAFNASLRSADTLDVRGEGATLVVPLDGSMAALERLDECFSKNAKYNPETNPFVAPSRKP